MNLTAKQEQFCQNIVLGMNQSEAYRKAYNAQNMARKTVWEKASRLATSHGKVRARIQALKRPQEHILAEYSIQAAERLGQLVTAREEIVDERGRIIGYRTNTMLNLRAAIDVLKYAGYGKKSDHLVSTPTIVLTKQQVDEALLRLSE